MLTSTLVSPNALKLLLPSSKAKTLEKQTISISITKDIAFYINENGSLVFLKWLPRYYEIFKCI